MSKKLPNPAQNLDIVHPRHVDPQHARTADLGRKRIYGNILQFTKRLPVKAHHIDLHAIRTVLSNIYRCSRLHAAFSATPHISNPNALMPSTRRPYGINLPRHLIIIAEIVHEVFRPPLPPHSVRSPMRLSAAYGSLARFRRCRYARRRAIAARYVRHILSFHRNVHHRLLVIQYPRGSRSAPAIACAPTG